MLPFGKKNLIYGALELSGTKIQMTLEMGVWIIFCSFDIRIKIFLHISVAPFFHSRQIWM